MTSTATKVLNIARSQLGYREGRRKDTKFGRWYGMNNVSWCDMFVSWVAVQAGAKDIIGRAAYTPSHAAWFRAIGRWHEKPQRGDIVFFDFPDSERRIQHVGIVESVRPDGRVVTIEGNTRSGSGSGQQSGGGVYRRVRSPSIIVGYGRPRYLDERGTTKMPPERASRGNRRPPLTVDGQWGRNTTRAVQRLVKVDDDGQIGPATRKAFQRFLAVTPDGTWGRVTRKALQKKLGVTVDGDWGPQTIKALQRRLNTDWRR